MFRLLPTELGRLALERGCRAIRLLNAGRMVTRRYAVAALDVCEDDSLTLPVEPNWFEDDLRQCRHERHGRLRVYVA
jgi:hypothetical protein